MSAFDAVVVGGGHNGLVATAYLAKAGLNVLCLERRARVGGLLGEADLGPGVRAPSVFHTAGRLRRSIFSTSTGASAT